MYVNIVHVVNWAILFAFIACFAYQVVFLIAPLLSRKKIPQDVKLIEQKRNYAVLVSARNEEGVIGQLIKSIKDQDYDRGLLDTYVVADNCTDRTAQEAGEAGAKVYVRNNLKQVGKGYALEFLFDRLREDHLFSRYDGFFIFDADNLLDKSFVSEIDKLFGKKYPVVMGFRKSRNLAESWISYDSGLWFLHDAQDLNRSRMQMGSSCMVSGTGYLIGREVLERAGGWKFSLLTEDVEFNAHCILNEEKIGYAEKAVYYDTQPVTFRDSWKQRLRWVKGYFQVYKKYGKKLLQGLRNGLGFGAYEMLMADLPAFIILLGALIAYVCLIAGGLIAGTAIGFAVYSLVMFFVKVSLVLLALGIFITISQWKNIQARWYRKFFYTLMFPVFLETYIPAAFAALTRRNVEWKHIDHTAALGETKSLKKQFGSADIRKSRRNSGGS